MNSEFLALDVEFSYHPIQSDRQYVDNLIFTYYLLLNTHSPRLHNGAVLVGTVRHTNIRARRGMASVMYVSPAALDRFFHARISGSLSLAIRDIGVTVSKDGDLVAFKSWKGYGMWWESFSQISGFLLRKDQTPFSSLLWDDYEQIQVDM